MQYSSMRECHKATDLFASIRLPSIRCVYWRTMIIETS